MRASLNTTAAPQQVLASLPADQIPFLLCRRHRLSSCLERSFKVEAGSGLLPHRYVLGIARKTISPSTWEDLLEDLQLLRQHPELTTTITDHFRQASTIYLGFEQGVSGANLRLYFEEWDAVVERLRHTPEEEIRRWQTEGPPSWPLMVGYKWPAIGRHQLILSRYKVHPLLDSQGIIERVERMLASARPLPGGIESLSQQRSPFGFAVLSLLQPILASDPAIAPVFLEVDEPGLPRRSFDLCLHRYQLRLQDLRAPLQHLLHSLLGTHPKLETALQGRSCDAWITHLSAGWSRHGLPYACIYYESPDGS